MLKSNPLIIDNTTAENNVKKTKIKRFLFKPNKIRVKEHSTFVSLVAPRADAGKAWKPLRTTLKPFSQERKNRDAFEILFFNC